MRRAMMRPLASFLCDECGESLITVAMSLTVMLAFTFGIMQVGTAYYNKERISEIAREGARYAIQHGSTCTTSAGSCSATAAQVATYTCAIGYPTLGGGSTSCPTPTYGGTGTNAPGNPITVTVSYTFPYKIPFVLNKSLTFTSSSTMYILM